MREETITQAAVPQVSQGTPRFSQVAELLRDCGHDARVLMASPKGGQVLVAPTLAGRVMGTSFDGPGGAFGGFVDVRAFREGMHDIWNNWGGEERYWLAPEGGQFGLMFAARENCFAHYRVQDGLNDSQYAVIDESSPNHSLTMKARFALVNAQGTAFQVEVARRITALDHCPYAAGTQMECIGFQSESTITNVGDTAWTRESGGLAHWHLGQFPVGPRVIVVVPFRQGPIADPPFREDYFEHFCVEERMPAHRYWIRDGFVLFKADGRVRTKIGQNRTRALGLLGSYNLDTHEIILLDFDFYPNLEYAASYWYEQPDPYNGDCLSFAAEGPLAEGDPPGRCYELECLSPAMFLFPGQSFTFRSRTLHLRGTRLAAAGVCRRHLGAERAVLEAFDRQSVMAGT